MHLHAKLGHIYAAFNEHLRLNESCAQLERIFSSPPPSDPSLAAEVRYGFASFLQGDNDTCSKPPVDFKPKVPLWPDLSCPSQAKTELLF